MKKAFLVRACMLLTACVENLIHISVFPSGEYSIKYNSIGDKTDFSGTHFGSGNLSFYNSEFGDLEHLNYKGAIVFSNWFSNLLKSGVLEKRNKQEFINAKIKIRENKN